MSQKFWFWKIHEIFGDHREKIDPEIDPVIST